MKGGQTLPSGVKHPALTGPVCEARTCMVFPDGTEVVKVRVDYNLG